MAEPNALAVATHLRLWGLYRMFDVYESYRDHAAAQSIAEAALAVAYAAGDDEDIGSALGHLDHIMYWSTASMEDDPAILARAVFYQLRALASRKAGFALHLQFTLSSLAGTSERRRDTWQTAGAAYAWLAALNPQSIEPLGHRYRILSQRFPDEIHELARWKKFASSGEIALTCAAQSALRQHKRATTLAEVGLARAREEQNPHLIRLFTDFRKR